uniref:uncharacterized protein n=1 Tax=Myxine glutinosa TaxID=7769 RepID=UPI00358EABAC
MVAEKMNFKNADIYTISQCVPRADPRSSGENGLKTIIHSSIHSYSDIYDKHTHAHECLALIFALRAQGNNHMTSTVKSDESTNHCVPNLIVSIVKNKGLGKGSNQAKFGATCILHFNPPRNIQGLWTLTLTLEDFATVNGQRNGPFSSIPLQVIIEFQPNAACASPKFVWRTPNNNDKFNITSRQPFSFDIDIQSSSSSESIVSLSTISSESVTWQNITRNPFSSGVFHTSMTLTPQANSEGEKQICFFATESSGHETELRCIIITIIQNCVPISYSYSPKDFNRDIITWSITFNKQLEV